MLRLPLLQVPKGGDWDGEKSVTKRKDLVTAVQRHTSNELFAECIAHLRQPAEPLAFRSLCSLDFNSNNPPVRGFENEVDLRTGRFRQWKMLISPSAQVSCRRSSA